MTKTKSYKNNYLRALADYQNFEKRVGEQKEDFIKSASKRIITKLLPLLNNLEKAEVFVKDPGLKLIKDELEKILKEEGLEELNVLGSIYNPEFAEAVEIIDGEQDNKIVEILRKGYKLNDKVIQVAQVKVSKVKKI
ncbi:nucleotide exchange factor GrpE [Candidatus Roizmanbacteria bacterium RIFCSPHIGHO2_12_FULL_33_9]|uniref:Protein GrpE n=1 Tax=Candidatus Roizmanbacteria bacterium RIFCSPHIGHO2_12_FULL_33_9 TaxID=1802045 RepID=A0A1F7HIV3_9BACT|nr:MAG: nucleotide exchange factor GrpE [Candidatus Roizmanbacteria bacterium RIFCSPHIGHO2_12_FULL_33_9]